VTGSREHGNEALGFIKVGECPDQLSHCHLLKKDSARWKFSREIPLLVHIVNLDEVKQVVNNQAEYFN
jgi:hypothetical protein